jgi:hypothetical protein
MSIISKTIDNSVQVTSSKLTPDRLHELVSEIRKKFALSYDSENVYIVRKADYDVVRVFNRKVIAETYPVVSQLIVDLFKGEITLDDFYELLVELNLLGGLNGE